MPSFLPRVLTLIYDLNAGGTQRAAQNFSIAYKEAGCPVAVLTYFGGGPREKELKEHGIPVFVGTQENRALAMEEAKRWAPQIVHVHRWGDDDPVVAAILTEFRAMGARVIETNVFSRVDRSLNRQLTDVHLHLSSWCLWKWSLELHRLGRLARLELKTKPAACVIPYIVHCDRFYRATEMERRQFREQVGIPENAFVFGRIGQASAGKWSPAIFSAFQKVASKHAEAFLLVVGLPDSLKTSLSQLPEEIKKRVIQIPFLSGDSALRICYSAMDVFLHSAQIGESFGMVLAEAMLCQCPVITVSTPAQDNSQLEVVVHGEGGLVVGQNRYLATAMNDLLENKDLRKRLAQNGPALIRERYDGKIVIPKVIRIAQVVLSAGSPEDLKTKLSQERGLVTDVQSRDIKRLLANQIGKTRFSDQLLIQFPRLHYFLRSFLWKLKSAFHKNLSTSE